MNVLLLGNGFDLNHKFPTNYIDFLDTVNFLINTDRTKISMIGHVFGNKELQEKNVFIKECYEIHSIVYDSTGLDMDNIEQMISISNTNFWFKYLTKSVDKNIKWIDFEKEIIRVIEAFTNFAEFQGGEDKFILKSFPFFFEKKDDKFQRNADFVKICNKYVREKISGSGTLHLCEEEIIEELYTSLRDLANILKLYLCLFIDTVSLEYKNRNYKSDFASMPPAERVYSFNYTNTYEVLYRPNIVEHIHGNTNSDIVLGVNPDENDETCSIDTSFLLFKKYFQRTFYSTDNVFLKKIYTDLNVSTTKNISLFVIGHSLDATDQDVIKLIFEASTKIYVLYHSGTSAKNQIKNLVQIYGKEGLDRLRAEKNLCFLKQSDVKWETVENE